MSPWIRAAATFPAIATAAFIYWLSDGPIPEGTLPSFRFSDKAAHALAYGFLALTLLPALRIGAGLPRPATVRRALLLAVMYGAFDEVHQGWVPGREKDLGDFLADTAGAGVAVLAANRYWKIKERHEPLAATTD
jgi:VanZ family protein